MAKSELKEFLDCAPSLEAFSSEPLVGSGMLLDDDLFHAFHHRALSVEEEDIDPHMWEVIQTMNQVEGIATVWCCSGHDVGLFKKLSGHRKDRGYLVWVGRRKKLRNVDRFFRHMLEPVWVMDLPYHLVGMGSLIQPPIGGWEAFGQYPCFTIEWFMEKEKKRIDGMRKLNLHIENYVRRQR